jgi:hypothetical protein
LGVEPQSNLTSSLTFMATIVLSILIFVSNFYHFLFLHSIDAIPCFPWLEKMRRKPIGVIHILNIF